MFKEYYKYIKNNPEGYWFKAKWYGWGWTPARWQGWAVVFGFVAVLIIFSTNINEQSTSREVIVNFVLPVLIAAVLLVLISYKTGEKPHWQWGKPKDTTPPADRNQR